MEVIGPKAKRIPFLHTLGSKPQEMGPTTTSVRVVSPPDSWVLDWPLGFRIMLWTYSDFAFEPFWLASNRRFFIQYRFSFFFYFLLFLKFLAFFFSFSLLAWGLAFVSLTKFAHKQYTYCVILMIFYFF